jgi:hypothetical protein
VERVEVEQHPSWCTRCTIGHADVLVGEHRSVVVAVEAVETRCQVTASLFQVPGRPTLVALTVVRAGVVLAEIELTPHALREFGFFSQDLLAHLGG